MAQITYLEGKKEQTSYHLRHLELLKSEKTYEFCFEYQKRASKVNITVLAVIKKEIRWT